MSELTISISPSTHANLIKLAENSGETVQTILDRAIENYRRYIFLVQANEAFAALRQNELLWQEELAERQIWDRAMANGVEE